jgi:hypothetical protein
MLDPGSAAADRNRRSVRIGFKVLILAVAAIFLPRLLSVASRRTPIVEAAPTPGSAAELWPISVDYPEDGSIFPPGITPPTFLWRDGVASYWNIDIQFADGAPPIHAVSKGERMHLGPIDPDCVSDTNELPRLSAQQAARGCGRRILRPGRRYSRIRRQARQL